MEQNTGTHFENIFASKSSLKPSLSIKRVGAPNFFGFSYGSAASDIDMLAIFRTTVAEVCSCFFPFLFFLWTNQIPSQRGAARFYLDTRYEENHHWLPELFFILTILAPL